MQNLRLNPLLHAARSSLPGPNKGGSWNYRIFLQIMKVFFIIRVLWKVYYNMQYISTEFIPGNSLILNRKAHSKWKTVNFFFTGCFGL